MPASALMNVMVAACRKAGRGLSRDFGELEQLQVSIKGPANFVSQADHKAEATLIKELSKAREGYGFVGEESGTIEGADKTHTWICDPLDGTTNFLHAIPMFAISLALVRESEIVAAIVHNPVMDETYTAEKGKGAFLNDKRLRVAARKSLTDAVISTGIPHRGWGSAKRSLPEIAKLTAEVAGLRCIGSAALDLCYVAAGRFDGCWLRDLNSWDIAAGILLIKEAGGIVTDSSGKQQMLETGSVIAGNASIQKALAKVVSD